MSSSEESSFENSKHAFMKHFLTYDQMHDQPSKKFMAHLGQDHIHSPNVRVSDFPSENGDYPVPHCQRCTDEGIWLNGECVCGCLPCVKRNDWTWGHVFMQTRWNNERWSFGSPLPCNGSRLVGPDEIPTEYTNLEVIVETLSEIWDHIPDWETQDPETVPRWSRFFDMAPERTHMIVCKELNLWQVPETARNLPMEPGQPWTLQQLIPDPNVLDDDTDGIAVNRGFLTHFDPPWPASSPNPGSGLVPRQLIQDGEEERKELCIEAQKLLDDATGDDGEFNEESYRLLSNIVMKIHQM